MNINALHYTDQNTGMDLEFEIREHQEILLRAGVDVEPGVYALIPEGPGYPHSLQVWSKTRDDGYWAHINSAGELMASMNPLGGL